MLNSAPATPPVQQTVLRCGSAAHIIDDIIPAEGQATAIINRIDVMTDGNGYSVAWVFTAKTDNGETIHVIEGSPALSTVDAKALNIPLISGTALYPFNGKTPSDLTYGLCKQRE